jgi:thiol-disulfide isomerase/thioredoxin
MQLIRKLKLQLIATLWFLLLKSAKSMVKEAADGSVCFNDCNGHGDCIDYSCHCHIGYHGDDCSTTFVIGDKVVPILSAGHFNVSRKNFTSVVTKNRNILIGFSSYNCHKCIQVEPEYEKIAVKLKEMKIPFARADADKMKSIALEHEASDVPSLVFFQKNRPLPYRGTHTEEAVIAFIEKQIGKPAIGLDTKDDVESFIKSRNSPKYSLSTSMVIGFFSEHEVRYPLLHAFGFIARRCH